MRNRSGGIEYDALVVDAALSDLRSRLDSTHDAFLRLVDLNHFVELHVRRLYPTHHAASFVLETVDLYDSLLDRPFDPCGLSPVLLEQAASTLSALVSEDSDPAVMKAAGTSIDRLTILAACQYTVIGGYDDAVRVLDLTGADIPIEPGAADDPLSWLGGQIRIRFPQHIAWTDGILDHVRAWRQPNERQCRFPAVFDLPSPDGDHVGYGCLRLISLDIHSVSVRQDRFSLAFVVDADAENYLDPVVTAGRTVLNALTPDAARQSYRGGFRIPEANARHAGRSAGLAMAALFVTEVQYFTDQRSRSAVNQRVVLTGSMDGSGRIEDVSPGSLAAKIEAVFFSPAEYFVVPRGQLSDAVRQLGRLRARFPRRNLNLLGKESLMDVFSDRRIVTIRERGRISHAAVRFWRKKWAVSAVSTALFFLTAFFAWQVNTFDNRPVVLDISEAGVRLLNVREEPIWHKSVSRATVDMHRSFRSGARARPALLSDVNADGYPDAFWVETPDAQEINAVMMFGLDGRTREPLWEPFSITAPLDYPFDVSIFGNQMRVTDMVAAELTGDELPEIVLGLAHRSYYPAVITIMDPRTGVVQPGYHHAGRFGDLLVVDLDGAHPPEILAVGTNNAYNTGVLVALDPGRLMGTGPATGYYRSSEPPTANEIAYLRFPLTELARYTGLPFGDAVRIDVLPEAEHLRIYTRDLRTMMDPTPAYSGLRWDLDYELRPISVGTDDHYDYAYERALEAGVMDAPLDNDFKISLMRNLERWTDRGWIPTSLSDRANLPPTDTRRSDPTRTIDRSDELSASVSDGRE